MKFISPIINIHGRKMVKYTMKHGKKTHVHAAHMSTPEKAMFGRPIKAEARERPVGEESNNEPNLKRNIQKHQCLVGTPPPPASASAALSSDAHTRSVNLMAMAEINANV